MRPKGHGVRRVPLEDLHRHGAALAVAQEAENNLGKALLAVTAMAECGQGTMRACVVSRGHIAKDQRAFLEVATCQFALNARLLLHQPIHRRIEIVFGDIVKLKEHPQTGGQGLMIHATSGG